MATVAYVFSIDYVAKLLDEDPELLQAIVSNDDNLNHGSIISVYTGPDEAITSLTRDGMEELEQMLAMLAAPPTNGTTSLTPSSTTKNSSLASKPNLPVTTGRLPKTRSLVLCNDSVELFSRLGGVGSPAISEIMVFTMAIPASRAALPLSFRGRVSPPSPLSR